MDRVERGITVFRASRLEALLQPLSQQMALERPANPLAPQRVVAPHLGMKNWLLSELARRDPTGIVANLEVLLPSQWMADCARRACIAAAPAEPDPYLRGNLRWRLLEAIRQHAVVEPELARVLEGAAAETQGFQLADRLSVLIEQYQVYRPDWLLAWQSGRDDVPEKHWLSALWRVARSGLAAHRAELQPALIQGMDRIAATDATLHVFGAAHLSPMVFEAVLAYARHARVSLYLPDPCVHYWVGMGDHRDALRRLVELDIDAERALSELGHPLLAKWGRLGQYFLIGLVQHDEQVAADIRHSEDESTSPALPSRLAAVQESIRQMEPALAGSIKTRQSDASLLVHRCHTPIRELEVLHDALLAALARDSKLMPGEIIVMAPDIARYAPFVRAVFGDPYAPQQRLPYHLADVRLRRTHSVFEAFAALLEAATPRIHLASVLGLLEAPALRRALDIDQDAAASLDRWLRRAGAIWGLDGASKAQLGLPAIEQNTLTWALERMLAGYVVGEGRPDAEPVRLQAVAALHGLEGDALPTLGALYRLLAELSEWSRALNATRPASAWSLWLGQRIDALFLADPKDAAESDAVAILRQVAGRLARECAAAKVDPLLDGRIVKAFVSEALESEAESQPFLSGGLTFCGMVPNRSLPFRMICVIGLDEDQFPRRGGENSLDLMRRHPRMGDRDVRIDDRYLFLETLMAARDRLHLSYVGEGVRDGKAKNPATPLADLLLFLDEVHGLDPSDDAVNRPWRILHPLQPFDRRYFETAAGALGDEFLFSYRREFRDAIAGNDDAPVAAAAFLSAPSRIEAITAAPLDITMQSLARFWRDPAKASLRDRLDVRLSALDTDALPETESLERQVDPRERLAERLFWSAIDSRSAALAAEPPRSLFDEGLLPPGVLGIDAYEQEREKAAGLLGQAPLVGHVEIGLRTLGPIAVELGVGMHPLTGQVDRLFETDTGAVLLRVSPKPLKEVGFRQLLPLYVEWLVLAVVLGVEQAPRPLLLCVDGRFDAALIWTRREPGTLKADLDWLVETMVAADQSPVLLFPRTSWALATAAPDKRVHAARSKWEAAFGDFAERTQAPGYYAWLTRGYDLFGADEALYGRLAATALRLHRMVLGVQHD